MGLIAARQGLLPVKGDAPQSGGKVGLSGSFLGGPMVEREHPPQPKSLFLCKTAVNRVLSHGLA